MTTGSDFPPVCDDVHHFNSELIAWLARASGDNFGKTHDSVVTTVPIGNERCQLRGHTTRDGVVAYLRLALDGAAAFFVVPSTQGVVHRVTVGSPSDRIQGFYLYTGQAYAEAQAIATANGTAFGWLEVCFKLLDAVALLHSRGHQRLRVLPSVGGALGWWRMAVVLAEDITYEHQFPHWEFDSAVFSYTSAEGSRTGGLKIGPDTSTGAIAREILAGATDAGMGLDWAYAGWYSELVAESHRLGALPVYDSVDEFPSASCWEIGVGSNVVFPPPPRANSRHGFPGELSKPPVEVISGADLVPFTAPSMPTGAIHGDITKITGFVVLHAIFREKHGAFIGLYARTRDTAYRREPGFGWVPVPRDAPELTRSARVAVNYRFIKAFEILATRDQRPDWDLADRMRIFNKQS